MVARENDFPDLCLLLINAGADFREVINFWTSRDAKEVWKSWLSRMLPLKRPTETRCLTQWWKGWWSLAAATSTWSPILQGIPCCTELWEKTTWPHWTSCWLPRISTWTRRMARVRLRSISHSEITSKRFQKSLVTLELVLRFTTSRYG